jgi:hypothetical protein
MKLTGSGRRLVFAYNCSHPFICDLFPRRQQSRASQDLRSSHPIPARPTAVDDGEWLGMRCLHSVANDYFCLR